MDTLYTVYLICAIAGGTLLLAQFVLGLLGLSGDHDVDADHSFEADHDASHGHEVGHEHAGARFLGVLTFRTVVAALTFFGLAGLAAGPRTGDDLLTLAIAVAAGVGALLSVAWLMKSLHRLKADGTVRIERAVGHAGTVYLTVPGNRAGVGKVTLSLQNRTVECQAVTAGEALPTGTKVVVVSVLGPDTVEIALASHVERTTHVA